MIVTITNEIANTANVVNICNALFSGCLSLYRLDKHYINDF